MAGFQQTSFAFAPPEPGASAGDQLRKSPRAKRGDRPAEQLRLPHAPYRVQPSDDPAAARELARFGLSARISTHLRTGELDLAITDNRSTMITVKRERGPRYQVRLHHLFLDADAAIVQALARYIAENDRHASQLLGEHIDANTERIQRARRASQETAIETAGEVHDLADLFDALNRRYFRGGIDARITWGRRGQPRRRRASIKLGSYSVEERLIRVHPSLDRRFVPRFFVEWIVFHEMLHQVHEIPVVEGRRQFHTPEFLAEERSFEHYLLARRWERDNLDKILAY